MSRLDDFYVRKALGKRPIRYDWCEDCRAADYTTGYYCRACAALVCRRHYVADYEMCRLCADMELREELERNPLYD